MKDIVVVQVSHKFEKIPFKSMYCVAGLPLIILYVKKLINEGKSIGSNFNFKKDNDLVEILEKFKVSYFRGSLKKINGEDLKNKKNFNQKFIDNTFLDNHRGNFRNVNSLFTIRTFEDFTIFKKFIEKQDNILNTSSKILLKNFINKKIIKKKFKKRP